jgi:hypothetical protein
VIGYKLNGNTLEQAFEKTKAKINNNLQFTQKYILELQKTLKNEKISQAEIDRRMLGVLRNLGPALLEAPAPVGGTEEAHPAAPHGSRIPLPSVPPAGADAMEP